MIPISRAITDLKGEFEGGSSFKVDFYTLFRRGGENLLGMIRPTSLKRVVPIYGGLSRHVGNAIALYCPTDVLVPSAIYDNTGKRVFSFPPPGAFHNDRYRDGDNTFTIETINGVKYLMVRKGIGLSQLILSEMDSVSGLTSDQTLTLNQFNFLSGTGAVQRTFSPKSGTAFTADAGTDFLTDTAHGLVNGDRIMVYNSGGALPAGLAENAVYFVVNKTNDTFQVSLTAGGSAINLTSAGTGTNYWYAATQNEISGTLASEDITEMLRGVAIVPLYLNAAADISRIELVLEEDTGKYYTVTSAQDSIGDTLRDGWNMVRFSVENAVKTGVPDATNITKWRLRIVLASGKTAQTIIVDQLSVQKSQFFLFEYYSKYLFKDGTTGAWKSTPVSGDYINLDDDDAIGALHYETAILTYQAAAFNRVDSGEKPSFEMQLARKYASYRERNPSSEMPPSYNIAPMVGSVDLPAERIGEFIHAEIATNELSGDAYYFADNIVPSGVIDGVNRTFTLAHTPNPVSSLYLYLNGVFQTQGADYTIVGNTITYVMAPSILLANAPHISFYRYSS